MDNDFGVGMWIYSVITWTRTKRLATTLMLPFAMVIGYVGYAIEDKLRDPAPLPPKSAAVSNYSDRLKRFQYCQIMVNQCAIHGSCLDEVPYEH